MRHFEYKGIKLILTDTVLNIFDSFTQNTINKNESGGILLGQIDEKTVYMVRATTPNKFDKASRYNFVRDKTAAQILADFEYMNSSKQTIYFGEWHTHPEDYPSPSGQDIKMIKGQYKLGKNFPPFIFLIIQGIKGIYVGIYNGSELIDMQEQL